MSNFLTDLSFSYHSTSLPFGGSFGCEYKKGERNINYSIAGDLLKGGSIEVWSIELTKEEEEELAKVLWDIIDQSPLAEETAIVLDGSPTSLKLKYNEVKIEHHWNSFSDHEVITQFAKLVSSLGNKPHSKRKLRMPPELEV